MPETHSKIAIALAEAIIKALPEDGTSIEHKMLLAAQAIDVRLAETRAHYKPKELAFCAFVTHHPKGPCSECLTAAMREFILLPEDLNV